MEIVATHTNVIVPEVLRRDNYKRWSILMRYYLLGQDLWDVVQSSQLPAGGNMSSEWMKKNALALHAIMISCGEEIFAQIKEKDSAKDVWDALADMHKSRVVHKERQTGPGNLASSQYETLIKAISDGELSKVKKFFRENSNAIAARISENGYTALHFAVYNGQKEIVDYLIESNLSLEELEIKDYFGNTALSIAARYGIGVSIAVKLVRKNRNLLTISDNDDEIPVELACSTIQGYMIRYLCYETPLESLNVDRGFYILQECIAFELLHRFPKLASHNCSSDSKSLILTLAQTSPPIFRGTNLSFWESRIYDCISVKAYVIKEDKHRSFAQEIEDKIEDFYRSCKMRVQHCFQMIQEKKQERIFQRKNQERIQRKNQESIQRMNQERRSGIAVWLLSQVIVFIIRILYFARNLSNFLFSLAVLLPVAIPILILLYLCKRILVALRMLVSMLSWYFGTRLYWLKLMDEYTRGVIRLICNQSLSELDHNQFVQSKAVEATFHAIKNGIPDIVKEIIKANANNVLWCNEDPEDPSRNIFACAIEHRQEEVARLLYESQKEKNMLFAIDEDGNNTLHLAAKLAPNYRSGYIYAAALQLQSELRWFKSVKEIVPENYKEGKNKDNETPSEVFVREHKDLLKEAEEWVKKTSESSTVVGPLIITIMFAVAFSVPGGNDQSTGFPVLLHKTPTVFMIFMVSDAISLFTASSSVLMFLGILTSHHSDEDYRKTFLLIIGLTSLFVSIATMTTAFCAALFIMLQGQGGWGLVIPITLFAGIPVVCYVLLQFPLLVEILGLTFSSNIFRKEGPSSVSRTAEMATRGMRNLSA